MTNEEIDDIIDWCRRRLNDRNIGGNWYDLLTGNRREGYEIGLRAVMSYLHGLKKNNKKEKQ